MTFTKIRWWVSIIVFVILALPFISMAAGIPTRIVPDSCDQDGGCQSICDIVKLAQNVLNFGIFMAVVISAFLFAYAGWNMLTSGGNSEMYAKGKQVFGNVLLGLIIILAGWIVVDTLMKTFIPESSFGPWNRVCLELLSHFEHFYA